jgi:hypothetical protein
VESEPAFPMWIRLPPAWSWITQGPAAP